MLRPTQLLRRATTWLAALNPFVKLVLIAVVVRIFALTRHYLGSNLVGQPIAVEPERFLPWAIPYHAGVLVAFALPFMLGARIFPRAERWFLRICAVVLGFVMLYGQIDLEVLRGLGTHLTPNFISHYFGKGVADLGSGLADDWPHLTVSVLLVVIAWFLFWRVGRSRALEPQPPTRFTHLGIAGVLAIALIAYPHLNRYSPARLRVVVPSEVLLLSRIFVDRATAAPTDPQSAVAAFREALAGRSGDDFLDDTLPLVRRGKSARIAATARPDIYMLIVESLRGGELRPERAKPGDYPNLQALMRRGVSFPFFVSNGFPSSAGFFSTHCSAWPHPSLFVLSEYGAGGFDCLPRRLGDAGYERVYFTAANPSLDNQLPWVRDLYDFWHIGDDRNDRSLVEDFSDWLRKRDDERPQSAPLFAWLATVSTHHPFLVKDDTHPASDSDELSVRYRHALQYADTQVGKMVSMIEERSAARGREAVIVIVGDHAFPVDEPAATEVDAQGCDRRVWTTAIVLGPERLVGPARELTFPASQVDLMPTLLAIVGDDGPTAALGRDLLDGDESDREAVVITEGGLRLDTPTQTIFSSQDGNLVWSEDRLAQSGCEPGAEPPDKDTRARADELRKRVQVWSWLVENQRVWKAGAGRSER